MNKTKLLTSGRASVAGACWLAGVLLLAAGGARGAEPGPPVVVLPTEVLSSVIGYMTGQPYNQVVGLLGTLRACIVLQTPGAAINVPESACPGLPKGLGKTPSPAQAPVGLPPAAGASPGAPSGGP